MFNDVINNGSIAYGPSNAAFFRVTGSWSGTGTFVHNNNVVTFAGGWMFDRVMAGWDVTVLIAAGWYLPDCSFWRYRWRLWDRWYIFRR